MSRKWKQMVWVVLQGIKSSLTKLPIRNCHLVMWDDFISISSVGLTTYISVLLVERDIWEILYCFYYAQFVDCCADRCWSKRRSNNINCVLISQVCEHMCIFRLLCKKVGDLLGDIHECTAVNTAGLLHSLSLSKFLFQTFSSGLRSLRELIKTDWMSCIRREVKLQVVLSCVCRKCTFGIDTNIELWLASLK